MTLRNPSSLRLAAPQNGINVFDFIPLRYQQDIANGVSTQNVSDYLNAAHTEGGPGAAIIYPNGTYIASNVLYYDDQSVLGQGGDSTIIQQPDGVADNVLVAWDWQNNITADSKTGVLVEGIGIAAGAGSLGGHGLIFYSARRSTLLQDAFTGLGTYLASTSQNGTPVVTSNIAGVHAINNIFNGAPLGAFYSTMADSSTDCYLIGNIISSCGGYTGGLAPPAGDPIGSIDVPNMSGWLILGNKIQNAPSRLLNCTGGGHNTIVMGNEFDYKCKNPYTDGTRNIAINVELDRTGHFKLEHNEFKGRGILDPSQPYTFLNVASTSSPGFPSFGNTVIGNGFDAPDGAADFLAFNINPTINAAGLSAFNTYSTISGQMTVGQQGNGDQVWGAQFAKGSPASGAAGFAGQLTWDAGFLYICTATGVWKRVALTGGY